MKRSYIIAVCILITACATDAVSAPTSTPPIPIRASVTASVDSPISASVPHPLSTSVAVRESATVSIYEFAQSDPFPSLENNPLSATPSVSVRESMTESVYNATDWKTLPIIPNVDPSIRAIYEYGQTLGNNPYAFSIFGDCQARPAEFLGVFDTDPSAVETLSPALRETVANFRGSFNRESSTAQDGTTPGALLWTQWHRGEYGCTFDETPVQCELRTHRSSFVIIQVGTHFESRNTEYLRRVITQLIDAGVVPILATKADNRELDDRINRDMTLLASEYDLPLWNFWAALSDLPNRGLYTRDDRPLQGSIYLNEEATLRHRLTGLEALNAVWRMATNTSR